MTTPDPTGRAPRNVGLCATLCTLPFIFLAIVGCYAVELPGKAIDFARDANPASGSCSLNGEDFTRIVDTVVEYRTRSVPQRTLDTHSVKELRIRRSPESHTNFFGEKIHACVVRKADWPEAMPAELGILDVLSDRIVARTPRGQEVELWNYDIDHWHLGLDTPWAESALIWE